MKSDGGGVVGPPQQAKEEKQEQQQQELPSTPAPAAEVGLQWRGLATGAPEG